MSSRPLFAPAKVITDGDMSAQIISKVTIIQNLSMASYDVSWSGSAIAGDISLQVSNTYSQNADGSVRNPGNWTDVPLTTTVSLASDSGSGFVDVEAIGAYAIRLVYTPSGGTGLMQATVNGKVS